MESAQTYLRAHLFSIINKRKMNVEDPDNPLHTHFKARSDNEAPLIDGPLRSGKFMKTIKANEQDARIAQVFAGNSPEDTADIIARIQPFLMEIDDGHLRTSVPELRNDLTKFVQEKALLDAQAKKLVVERIVQDWSDNVFPTELEKLDELEREISKERKVEKLFDLPPMEIIGHCFTPLLQEAELTDENREKLLERAPIYTQLIVHASQYNDAVLFQTLSDTMKAYARKMGLDFIDLPHANLLIAISARDVDKETYLQFLR